MKFEMSIVLRRRTARRDNEGVCPQCKYVNSAVDAPYGWIEWQVLLSSFDNDHG